LHVSFTFTLINKYQLYLILLVSKVSNKPNF